VSIADAFFKVASREEVFPVQVIAVITVGISIVSVPLELLATTLMTAFVSSSGSCSTDAVT